MNYSASTFTAPGDLISLNGPGGTTIDSPAALTTASGFLAPATLTAAGTYTVVVDPSFYGDTGSITIAVASITDITGTITPGTPVAVNITTTGQRAFYGFSAPTAGDTASFQITNSTFTSSDTVYVIDGTGTVVGSSYQAVNGTAGPVTLGASGSYQIVVDPTSGDDETGTLTLTLTLTAPATSKLKAPPALRPPVAVKKTPSGSVSASPDVPTLTMNYSYYETDMFEDGGFGQGYFNTYDDSATWNEDGDGTASGTGSAMNTSHYWLFDICGIDDASDSQSSGSFGGSVPAGELDTTPNADGSTSYTITPDPITLTGSESDQWRDYANEICGPSFGSTSDSWQGMISPDAVSGTVPAGQTSVNGHSSCGSGVSSGGIIGFSYTVVQCSLDWTITVPEVSDTTLAADPVNAVVGQPVEANVQVDSATDGPTPTGTVTVSDGDSQTCTATLSDGSGSCKIKETAIGGYTLTATYNGDATYGPSTSDPEDISVSQDATKTALTAAPASGIVTGQAVMFTATVSASSPGGGTPTGSVTITDGTQTCTATLAAGDANKATGTCPATVSMAGADAFTASYSGDDNFISSSANLSVTVGGDPTSTTITSISPTPVVTGQAFMVAFSVSANSPGSGTPTGKVTVTDGTQSCSAMLEGGSGSCRMTGLMAGASTALAAYAGDVNYLSSSSAPFGVTIDRAATNTTITSTTPKPVAGQPIMVVAAVGASPPGSGTPTGTVTVSDGLRSCTAPLSGGSGSCQLTEPATGGYTFTATYNGDQDFTSSTSTGMPVTVSADPTSTGISTTTATARYGQEVSERIMFVVAAKYGGPPTGTVQVNYSTAAFSNAFLCDVLLAAGQGLCAFQQDTLLPGSYKFSAAYGGGGPYKKSKSPSVSLVISETTSTALKLSAAKVTYGSEQSERLTVTITPEVTSAAAGAITGTVTITASGRKACSITLSAGKGACTLGARALPAGSYQLVAAYVGTAVFGASASRAASLVVAP